MGRSVYSEVRCHIGSDAFCVICVKLPITIEEICSFIRNTFKLPEAFESTEFESDAIGVYACLHRAYWDGTYLLEYPTCLPYEVLEVVQIG